MINNSGYMWVTSIDVCDEDIWMLRGDVCSIWKYSITEDALEFIDIPEAYSYQSECQYISIIIAESKLFLIPYIMNDVLVYDIEHRKWLDSIPMPSKKAEGSRFIGAVSWKGNIYCFPEKKPDDVIVIDAYSLSVTEVVNLWEKLPNVSEQINEIKISDDGQIVGIVRFKKIAFIYDTETKDVRLIVEKANNDSRWNTIDCYRGQLFISGPEMRKILVYDLRTLSLIRQFKIPFIKIRMHSICEKLVVDATTMDSFWILDTQSGESRYINTQKVGDVVFDKEYMTGLVVRFAGKLAYYDRRRAAILLIDNDTYESRKLNVFESETNKMKRKIAIEMKNHSFLELEDNVVGLAEFINIIIK